MASIRENHPKTGEVTYSVLFRRDKKQTSETFRDRKAADRFARLVDLLGAEKALAELNGTDRGGLTLDEVAEQFLQAKANAKLTERTVADYRRDYANWISPHLGHRQASAIDEIDVQRLVDHMSARLDPKTVAGHHALLSAMFRWGSARTRRLVEHNPCSETELPKRRKKPPKGITIAEWQAIYATATTTDPALADFLLFLVSTGWRWSEVAALKWRDVEDYGDEMFVSMRIVNRRSPGTAGRDVEDAKNDTSKRRTRVGPAAAAMIRRRNVAQSLDGYVFTNPRGGRWHQANFRDRHWIPLVTALGIRTDERQATPHWLRHTHAALLDRAGTSMPKMSRRLGHSNIQTTVNVYGGMIEDVDAATLERVDALLWLDGHSSAEAAAVYDEALSLPSSASE